MAAVSTVVAFTAVVFMVATMGGITAAVITMAVAMLVSASGSVRHGVMAMGQAGMATPGTTIRTPVRSSCSNNRPYMWNRAARKPRRRLTTATIRKAITLT